jgi:hypothetical protein
MVVHGISYPWIHYPRRRLDNIYEKIVNVRIVNKFCPSKGPTEAALGRKGDWFLRPQGENS